MAGSKTKSKRQVGFLLGDRSPLSGAEKSTLKREIGSGAVAVTNVSKRKRGSSHRSRKHFFQK